jgi:manganese efflux pump family protein
MISLLLLALALAMDAFAVSLCQGCATRPGISGATRMALAFGGAQAVMPLLGWGLGTLFAGAIDAIDHWVAFVLLGALGIKMAWEGFQPLDDCPPVPLAGRALFAAAIATSIDAAAAGITLPTIGVNIGVSVAVIGLVTAVLCFVGALGGARLGTVLGKRAEVLGGVVLMGLGVHVLAQHMGWMS